MELLVGLLQFDNPQIDILSTGSLMAVDRDTIPAFFHRVRCQFADRDQLVLGRPALNRENSLSIEINLSRLVMVQVPTPMFQVGIF